MDNFDNSNFKTAQNWNSSLESLLDTIFDVPDLDHPMASTSLVADTIIEAEGERDDLIFDSLVEPISSHMGASLFSHLSSAEQQSPLSSGLSIETISNVVSSDLDIPDAQNDEFNALQLPEELFTDGALEMSDSPFPSLMWSERELQTLAGFSTHSVQTPFRRRDLGIFASSLFSDATLHNSHDHLANKSCLSATEITEGVPESMEDFSLLSVSPSLGLSSHPTSTSGTLSLTSSPPPSATNSSPTRLRMSTSSPQVLQEIIEQQTIRRLDLDHLDIIFDALAESKLLYALLLPILKHRPPKICLACRKNFNSNEEETRHILSHLQGAIVFVYPHLNPSDVQPELPDADQRTAEERVCWLRVAEVLSAVLDRHVTKDKALVKEFVAVLDASKNPANPIPATPLMAAHTVISQYPARWIKNQACNTHATAPLIARWDKFAGKGHCDKYAGPDQEHCERNIRKAEVFPPPDTTWDQKLIVDMKKEDWGKYPSFSYPIHKKDRMGIQEAAKGKQLPYADGELKNVPQRATRSATPKAASGGVRKRAAGKARA